MKPQKTSRKKSKSPLRDLADFRASLWKTLARNSEHLTGLQVAQALREVSDDIYHAGIDSAYTTTKARDPQNLADAWDLTWLTALNVKLLHLQKSRPRRKRVPRTSVIYAGKARAEIRRERTLKKSQAAGTQAATVTLGISKPA